MLIEGPVEVALPDGRVVRSHRFTAAVCLSGRSTRYPWCDADHRRCPPTDGGVAPRRHQRGARVRPALRPRSPPPGWDVRRPYGRGDVRHSGVLVSTVR
ncbi:CDGSH iron-sulfur domain-containing protein [Streptomyces sp. NA02950]|uniref:CDGSH iron-sulfur domain-containing protein n=1 Tax=Streptomyces sp. NA02950 TaxID=2742137 RepID=UPI00159085D0|nr:CDGSH iron-sulfur domain-containing protein [Streptomyces sp. NA02950]QKV90667.1 CDGSH iron-sulfur domain-containing protein [Streptomyces sp. NA02950]